MEKGIRVPGPFYLLAIVSLVAIIASFGAPLPWVPFAEVALDHPTAASSDGTYTAVATDQARKVLIVDGHNELCASIDYETFEAPLEIVTDVCVSNGRVYVAGVRYKPDSNEIALERVVAYGMNGAQQGIVYEQKGQGTKPGILSLDDQDGGVRACVTSPNKKDNGNTDVRFLFLADGAEPRELTSTTVNHNIVASASYIPSLNKIVTLSQRGVINDDGAAVVTHKGDDLFTSLALSDAGQIVATDDVTHALCEVADDGTVTKIVDGLSCTHIRIVGNTITLLDADANEALVYYTSGNIHARLESVMPRVSVSLRVVSLWVCAAYLVVFLFALAVRHVRRLLATGTISQVAGPVASFAVVLTVGLTLGHTAFYTYRAQVETRSKEVGAYADYFANNAHTFSEALSPVGSRTVFRDSVDLTTQQNTNFVVTCLQISGLIDTAEDNGIGMYCVLYGRDDKGIYCMDDSLGEYMWGESVSESNRIANVREVFANKEESSKEMHRGSSRHEDTMYRTVYIPATGEGSNDFVIEVGSKMKSFTSSVASNLVRNALALLVLALVIYMTYAELQACGRCVLRYRRMQQTAEKGAVSALARPFALTTMMLAGVDAVMSTLIAREMLVAAGMGDATALVTIPAVMLGVGQALGQGVYGLLGAKVGLRKLMARGATVMLACAILVAASVVSGSFWAYCAAKFVLAVPFGLLYTAAYSLRRHAVTPEQQRLAKAGVKRSNTSSAALGTALGGYAAQGLGNVGVYIMIALVSLAVITMAIILLPKGTLPPEDDRDFSADERRRIRKFVLSPVALAIALCIILPSVVVTGYASTLFPLFSADLGFAKADINNMYLFGQLIVYVSIGWIERLSKRIGNWRAGDYSIAGLGIVFLCFSLNTTIVWGVVVIALVGLLVKIANAWKPLWITSADKANVPLGWATGAMFVVRSVARIAKPFILTGLILVGGRLAIIVIGALCLVCAATLYFVTRKQW